MQHLQVLSQPHHHCKSSAAHLLSSSRSLDYWWPKGRGGNRNNGSISVNIMYNLSQNIALAGPFFFAIYALSCHCVNSLICKHILHKSLFWKSGGRKSSVRIGPIGHCTDYWGREGRNRLRCCWGRGARHYSDTLEKA